MCFSGLGNLAWSYAKQAILAEAVMESVISSTGRLAVYETMCLDVGESLIHRLFTNIATSALHYDGGLSRFKPQGRDCAYETNPSFVQHRDDSELIMLMS